ncbi:MAG: SDR family NAD(P)-dependent oxidoreductase [Lachnospiraceae bacterium]|nr:SDR family NAD(P)-dependent oxidoreductase [Lachnospiraceae bacterium]
MAAIVTGGGSGIGFEIAKILYLEEGQDLILVGRNEDRLMRAKKRLETESKRKSSGKAEPIIQTYAMDVSSLSACREFHSWIESHGIAADYLVNAAGFGTIGPFLQTDLDREARETDTNCRGLLQMTKLFLPDLMRVHGCLLNVASSAGYMPGSPGMAVYYATKAYVLSLTRSISAERDVRRSKVLVSALCPGPVSTEFSEKAGGSATSGLAMISPQTCARAAVCGMKKGKHLIIPGGLMKCTYPLAKLLPASWLLFFAGKHQDQKLKS